MFLSWMFLSCHLPRNPNYPHEFSRKAPAFAAPWPDFIPRAGGENYKELSVLLPNRQGLKRADCSFWSKYIQSLKAAAAGGEARANRGWQRAGGWFIPSIDRTHCAADPGCVLGATESWSAINTALLHEELPVGGGGAPVLMGEFSERLSLRARTPGI